MRFVAALIAAAILAAFIHTMRPGPDQVALVLAELASRQTAAPVRVENNLIAEAAAQLRSIYDKHPKQKALYRSKAKRKATRKTRRAGATAGGVRELLARAIEISGFRATYVTTTKGEARERAWKNDTHSGFLDVLIAIGAELPSRGVAKYSIGGVVVEVREADLALEFANGSKIDLFGIDTLRAINKKRGNSKHVFWIDEAQDFRFLNDFYKGTILGAITDFEGECWLSGTPGRDPSGMFFEVTRDDEDALPGWEVHEIAVTDNPYFGCVVWEGGLWFVVDNLKRQTGPYANEVEAEDAAVKIRWNNTAGKHIRENNLNELDPDVQREWFARWVKDDLAYVYPVTTVPKHVLTFAPQRLRPNPFVGSHPRFAGHPPTYDHQTALLDLPRKKRGRDYQWLFAMGADFGYYPDPFAIVLWGFTRELPDVYEMYSWKHTRVITDDQAAYLLLVWNAVSNLVVLVGDPAGKQDDFETWRQRFSLPMEEANKQGKNALEEFLANAIRRNHVHYREGSPLLLEHKHLVYLPQKMGKTREVDKHRRAADGIIYGDHCSDAGRYSYAHVDHYLYADKPPKHPAGSVAAQEAEEEDIEKHLDDAERTREKPSGDDEWEPLDGGMQW